MFFALHPESLSGPDVVAYEIYKIATFGLLLISEAESWRGYQSINIYAHLKIKGNIGAPPINQ